MKSILSRLDILKTSKTLGVILAALLLVSCVSATPSKLANNAEIRNILYASAVCKKIYLARDCEWREDRLELLIDNQPSIVHSTEDGTIIIVLSGTPLKDLFINSSVPTSNADLNITH